MGLVSRLSHLSSHLWGESGISFSMQSHCLEAAAVSGRGLKAIFKKSSFFGRRSDLLECCKDSAEGSGVPFTQLPRDSIFTAQGANPGREHACRTIRATTTLAQRPPPAAFSVPGSRVSASCRIALVPFRPSPFLSLPLSFVTLTLQEAWLITV